MTIIRGILPALLTPFTEQGQVNTEALRTLTKYLIGQGVHGFFVTGGTGEGVLLDPDERKLVLETVLDEVNGQVPVIAHVGALATRTAADLAAHAASAGATAIAAVPPFYFGVDTLALQAHYRLIAEAASGLPLWVYHIPGATGVNLTPEVLATLLEIDQVHGIKYSSHNFYQMRTMIEMTAERDFSVLSGPDEMCLPALTMGAHGAIGATYNLIPRHFVELYDAYQAGDLERAQELQYAANRVIHALLATPMFAGLKLLVSDVIGIDCGVPRRPLPPLTPEQAASLRAAMAETSLAAMTSGR